MSEEIDHEYTSQVVCPHCGYEWSDSHETFGNDLESEEEFECDECERPFYAVGHVEVTFSTRKKDDDDE